MNSKKLNIYVISLILIILDCAYAFISKTFLKGTSTFISLVCFLSFFLIYKDRKPLSKSGLLIYLFMSMGLLLAYRFDLKWSTIAVVRYLPLLTFFMMKRMDLERLCEKLIKSFCVLISLSLAIYFLNLTGVPVLNLGRTSWLQYTVINYGYLYVDSLTYFNKFTGFCVEPGYFGFLCICLLSLNEFDFKKKSTLVFALALLLSLSLEAYLLFIVGLLLYSASKGENIKKLFFYVFIAIFVLSLAGYFAMNYNGGNNIVNEKIFARLAFDESLGIVGNNRESVNAEAIIDSVFYTDRVWLGIGDSEFYNIIAKYNYDVCSWRVFVVVYGAIYTIVSVLISIAGFTKTNIRKTLPFFVIFWMDFYPHGSLSSESLYILVIIFLLNNKSMNSITTRK